MAPIVASRVTGRFLVLCDHCRSPLATEIDAPTIDAARGELVKRGWLECARKGKGRERWAWRCPACNPITRGSAEPA